MKEFTSKCHPSHFFGWRRVKTPDQTDGKFGLNVFHRLLFFEKLTQTVW